MALSLVGTFAVMYVLGFSLDNLSLMALTIAIGFVVDDAIVMIENIVRNIEGGAAPMAAAIKGAGEIGFTILSISISLIAVFIPLFLMSGVIGLLFREFAVTVAVSVVVSLVVSLTLTPMMCARLLTPPGSGNPGRVSQAVEHLFDRLVGVYDRALVVALHHRRITLTVMILAILLTLGLFVAIPKGFFPQQDTGMIVGISEGAQDISPQAMMDRQRALLEVAIKDPAVASATAYIGPGGSTVTENNGRMFITLKPHEQRSATADQVIMRLNRALQPIQGVKLYMQSAQDINVGARLSKTQYQYTMVDVDSAELDHWAPVLLQKMQALPQLADVASDQQSAGRTLNIEIKRDVASRLGIDPALVDAILYDAFGQRHVARIYTTLNQYYVILEVDPGFQLGPNALSRIYAKSASGTMVPLSQLASIIPSIASLAVNHQGQFPSVTLSFNLAANSTIGNAVTAIRKAAADLHLPPSITTSFQGNAQAFQSSLSSTPILIVAALVAVYIILGILYESTIHPFSPVDPDAVRNAARCHRHHRHHPAHRHREEERHHADRLCAGGRARARAQQRRGHSRGMPAAVPPHSDDNAVRAPRRRAAHAGDGDRVGNSPAARLCNGWRLAGLATAHAVHDPDRLYLHGSHQRIDARLAITKEHGYGKGCQRSRQLLTRDSV